MSADIAELQQTLQCAQASDCQMVCIEASMHAGARIQLPDQHEDRCVYVVDGNVSVAGEF